MEQHQEEMAAAGLRSVAIGLGEPKHARHFCGRLAPSITCLCNKSAEAYAAFGLKRGGILQLAGPQVMASTMRAVAAGQSQGSATGDATMLGGVFVVDERGVIRFAHYSQHAGDHPEWSDLLAAVDELAVAAGAGGP